MAPAPDNPARASTSAAQAPASAEMPLSYRLGLMSRVIVRELSSVRRPDIPNPQIIPLLALRVEPGLSNAELARRCHVSPQSMNEVVFALEGEGLIQRAPAADNRRILRARLTDEGHRQLARCEEAVAAMEARPFDGFTARELDEVRVILQRCIDNMADAPRDSHA